MSTKQQRAEFRQKAEEIIRKHGGKPTDNSYPWAIETEYGLLRLRVDDFESSRTSRKWTGTVFTRFDDLKRLPRFSDINWVAVTKGYYGKWNHHYLTHWTVYGAVLDFQRKLELVAPLHPTPPLGLGEHAEAWWREQGREVPPADTPEWDEMYEKWVDFAFDDFAEEITSPP